MFPLLQSRCYGVGDRLMLYNAARGNKDFIQRLTLERKLEVHNGCVNSICWNEKGTSILSGSDDQHLVITDPFTGKIVHKIKSGHKANIFSAKFLPSCDDTRTVSCSGDGKIYYTNIDRDDTYGSYMFDCHYGTTYEVIVIPNEASTFLSCGEDGTVRFFDLRAKTSCNKPSCKDDVLISCRSALTALTANPLFPWQLGVGCSDSSVRIYDRRMLGTRATGNYAGRGIKGLITTFTPPNLKKESYRVTSLNFSPDGEDVLASYSSEFIYLFGTNDPESCRKLSKEIQTREEMESNPDVQENTEFPAGGASTSQQVEDTLSRSPPVSRASPVKRLRLRGDWSDTGPGARPERERQSSDTEASASGSRESQPALPISAGGPRAAMLTRMYGVLTRWLRDSQDRGQPEGQPDPPNDPPNDPPQTGSQGNMEPSSTDTASAANQSDSNLHNVTEARGQRSSDDIQGATSQQVQVSYENAEDSAGQSRMPTNDLNESFSAHSVDTFCSSSRSTSLEHVGSQRLDPVCSDFKSDESQSSFVQKIESMNVDDDNDDEQSNFTDRAGMEVSEGRMIDPSKEPYNPLQPTVYHGSENIDQNKESNESIPVHESIPSAIIQPVAVVKHTAAGTSDKSKGSNKENRTLSPSRNSAADNMTGRNDEVADLSDTSHMTENPSYMTETVRYRDTVLAAANELRAQNVTPVVSLHYSPEGTSASTIKVGFTQFQNIEDEMRPEQLHSGVGSEPVAGTVNDSDRDKHGSVSYTCASDNDRNEMGIKSGNNDMNKLEVNQEESFSLSKQQIGTEAGSLASVTDSNSDRVCSVSNMEGVVNNEIKQGTSVLNTELCDSGGAFKPFSVQTADNEQHLLLADQSEQKTESSDVTLEQSTCSEMPSCSYSNPSSVVNESSKTTETVAESASCKNNVPDSFSEENNQRSVNLLETRDEQNHPRPVVESRTVNEPAARPRQRRIGHSGPPTGNFQLYDPPGGSSGHSSSEEEEESAARRRTDFERTTAALKLQAFHRLRQEAKEKKEMESSNVFMPKVKQVYKGHRNARTMIKESNFWGDRFVLSGSDCGHVFIWDRYSAEVVMLLEADKHVVNCIQPHPFETSLATSGIDYDVKIWAPLLPKSGYDRERASEVMHRNAIMLEETRDTITVPAIFMLRVLASINNVQSGRRGAAPGRQGGDDEQHSDTE